MVKVNRNYKELLKYYIFYGILYLLLYLFMKFVVVDKINFIENYLNPVFIGFVTIYTLLVLNYYFQARNINILKINDLFYMKINDSLYSKSNILKVTLIHSYNRNSERLIIFPWDYVYYYLIEFNDMKFVKIPHFLIADINILEIKDVIEKRTIIPIIVNKTNIV